MSSFGSQARLAELTAAASARERQARRELEDQHKAPQNTPVSLSALTRASVTTRNKGPKSYRPLTIDDIGDEAESHDLAGGDGARPNSEADISHPASNLISSTIPMPSREGQKIAATGAMPHNTSTFRPFVAEPVPVRPDFDFPPHMYHPTPSPYRQQGQLHTFQTSQRD